MKFNWGHGIAIFLTLFVAFIGGLGYMATQSSFDLEAEDYYAKELKYQETIDALERGKPHVNELTSKFISGQGLMLQLEKENIQDWQGAQLNLQRANDSSLDRVFTLQFDKGRFLVPTSELKTGRYDMRILAGEEGREWIIKNQIIIP